MRVLLHRSTPLKAFSLAELLVCLGIIAILLFLSIAGLAYVRKASAVGICTSNLRQIGVGFDLYANDHNGGYPPHWGIGFNGENLAWYGHIAPYITGWRGESPGYMSKIFYCPANPRPFNARQTYISSADNLDQSYGYNYQYLSSNPQWPSRRKINFQNMGEIVLAADIPTLGDTNDIVPFPEELESIRLYPAMAPDRVNGLKAISQRHSGGCHILFLDGSVQWRNSRDFLGKDFKKRNWVPVEM